MGHRWRGCLFAALFTLATMVAHAADPAKVLRVAFQTDVTGFDPQVANEVYSLRICRAIFDSLLQYDYLERPYALKPSTAQALPEIRDGGRTMVFKLKPGIYFAPDPAFKNKPRELVAEDYVYSWKRLIDPKMRSFWSFLLDGKMIGADERGGGGQTQRQIRLRRQRSRVCWPSIVTRCNSSSSSRTMSCLSS